MKNGILTPEEAVKDLLGGKAPTVKAEAKARTAAGTPAAAPLYLPTGRELNRNRRFLDTVDEGPRYLPTGREMMGSTTTAGVEPLRPAGSGLIRVVDTSFKDYSYPARDMVEKSAPKFVLPVKHVPEPARIKYEFARAGSTAIAGFARGLYMDKLVDAGARLLNQPTEYTSQLTGKKFGSAKELFDEAINLYPTAGAIGNVVADAGVNVVAGGLIGELVYGLPIIKNLPGFINRAIGTAAGMGAVGAVREAENGGDAGDIARRGMIDAAGAAAGSLAAGEVGKWGGKLLEVVGASGSLPAQLANLGVSASVFAGGRMGTRYLLDPNYRPTQEEVAQDLITSGLFAVLTGYGEAKWRAEEGAARANAEAATPKTPASPEQSEYFREAKTREELKDLYRKLALANHPDLGGNADTMAKINAEYEALEKIIGQGVTKESAGGILSRMKAWMSSLRNMPQTAETVDAENALAVVVGEMERAAGAPLAGLGGQEYLPADVKSQTVGNLRPENIIQSDGSERKAIGTGPVEDVFTPTTKKLVQSYVDSGIDAPTGVQMTDYLPRGGEVSQGGDIFLPRGAETQGTTSSRYIDRAVEKEEIQKGIQDVARLLPVAEISGAEFGKGEVDLITQVSNFFQSEGGMVYNSRLGDVVLDRHGVKEDLGHGIGRKKAAAFAAVPAVLEHGMVIDHQTDWKGRGYDTAVVAAPIKIGGEEYLEGIVLTREGGKNRFYVHEVLAVKNDEAMPFKTGGSSMGGLPGGTAPSVISLLRQVADVKRQLAQEVEAPKVMGPITAQGEIGEMSDGMDHMTQAEREMWENSKQKQTTEYTYKGTQATGKLGIEIEKPITDLGASKSLRAHEKAKYQAQQELNKVLKESHATEGERRIARGIADGIYTMEQLMPGMNPKTIGPIVEAMRAVDSFRKSALKDQKERTNWDFDARVEELIKNSDKKTSPGALSLNANTMQRNNERVWGDDAKDINAELFDPITANEAERIRFVNQILGRIEKYHLTDKESELVQRLSEKEISEGDLKADGYDTDRLSAAAKEMSGIYNDLHEAINDFLVAHGNKEIGFQKNYAPHMQPEQMDTLQRYLQRLGFTIEVHELPTDLAGRTDTFKPGKQYNPYFQPRRGNKTVYDAVRGLESYVNYISNVFYHTDDIQKLRRFSEALRTKYSGAEVSAELDRLNSLQDRLASEEYGSEIDIQELKEKAFERLGRMTKFGDYVSVLDDYTNILAGKQAKFDRSMESLLGRKWINLGKNVQNIFAKAAVVGNISSALNQTVQIPQLIAEMGPRRVIQAIFDVTTGKTGKSGFTQESNFLTGKRGIRSISEKSIDEKVLNTAAIPFEAVDDFASRIVVRAKYLEQVGMGKDHKTALREADRYAERLMGSRMKGAKPVLFEIKNPFVKAVTTFQLEVANGWQHIRHDLPNEIKEIEKTQGTAAAAKRLIWMILAGQIAAFTANLILKKISGREPVPFDGIGMVSNYMASGYGMTKEDYMKSVMDDTAEGLAGKRPLGTERATGKFDLPRAATSTAKDALDNVPLIGNATTMLGITEGRLPLPKFRSKDIEKGVGDAWTAMTDEDEEKRQKASERILPELGAGVLDIGSTWVPMGGQIKKTVQGAGVLAEGGSYSGYGEDKKLQYQVEQSPQNIVKGLLFGKNALPETDQYYAEGEKPLSIGQTKVYRKIVEDGVKEKDAYQVIRDVNAAKKEGDEETKTLAKVSVLESSALEREQQAEVYRGMLASDGERKLMKRLEETGASMDAVYSALVGIRRARDPETGKTDSNKKREAIITSKLTDKQKIIIYQDRVSDKRGDDIVAVLVTGVTFDDFLRAQNEYTAISEREGSATDKATEFSRWMNGQSFTENQYSAVRNAFKFYSQIPATETIYERFVGAGVNETMAYDLSAKLSKLTPDPGKEQVSAIQKSRVIVDSGMDDARKVAALEKVMSETDYLKMSTAYQYGVPPDAYISYRERLARVETKGSVNQAEAKWAIDGMNLPREQKAALWQLQNTSWKPWSNPYSQSMSGQVLGVYKSEKAKIEPKKADDGKIHTKYGGEISGSGTIQTKYGSDSKAGGTGKIQTKYGAERAKSGAVGRVQTKYGGENVYLQTAEQIQQSGKIITKYGG